MQDAFSLCFADRKIVGLFSELARLQGKLRSTNMKESIFKFRTVGFEKIELCHW